MPVWIVLGVCAAVFIMAIAVAGSFNLFNGGMPAASESQPRPGLSEEFTVDDVANVTFSTAIRGYRMDEVDKALDTLRQRIIALEAGSKARNDPDSVATTDSREPTEASALDIQTSDGRAGNGPHDAASRPVRDTSVPRTFPAGDSAADRGAL